MQPSRVAHRVIGRRTALRRRPARRDRGAVAVAGCLRPDVGRQHRPAHRRGRGDPGSGQVAVGAGRVHAADVDADHRVAPPPRPHGRQRRRGARVEARQRTPRRGDRRRLRLDDRGRPRRRQAVPLSGRRRRHWHRSPGRPLAGRRSRGKYPRPDGLGTRGSAGPGGGRRPGGVSPGGRRPGGLDPVLQRVCLPGRDAGSTRGPGRARRRRATWRGPQRREHVADERRVIAVSRHDRRAAHRDLDLVLCGVRPRLFRRRPTGNGRAEHAGRGGSAGGTRDDAHRFGPADQPGRALLVRSRRPQVHRAGVVPDAPPRVGVQPVHRPGGRDGDLVPGVGHRPRGGRGRDGFSQGRASNGHRSAEQQPAPHNDCDRATHLHPR